ncbi:MAG: hypothetical protein U0936_26275 [Planctomycetaceae bacterium]
MEKSFLFTDVTNPTWLAYVAFLVIAVFFRFSRVLTIRNLDLTLLLLLSTAIVVSGVYRDKAWVVPSKEDTAQSAAMSEESPANDETAANSVTEAPLQTTAADTAPSEMTATPEPAAAIVESSSEPSASLSVAEGSANKLPGEITSSDGVVASPPTTSENSDKEPVQHPIYIWSSVTLMALTILLIVRLLFDESLTRRPRLDQNLNQSGITFLCIPAFAILMVSVFKNHPEDSTFKAVEHGRALLERRDVQVDPQTGGDTQPAPTETLIAAGGAAMAQLSGNLPKSKDDDSVHSNTVEELLARILVVIAHTFVVLGLLTIGRQHFASLQIGISMSCLYLLLPCTAVNVHELNHVLPAACLVWAIASYRNPVVSGVLLGLASGTLFFAAFLLPLWAVFYGKKGGLRFVISVLGIGAVLITSLLLISGDASSFTNKLVTTANWTAYRLLDDSPTDGDATLSQLFIRIPMAAIFFVMLTAMTVLPRPRNLENLLSNSTCLVVAAQMWYPDDIGTYVLWYLPLFLIVIFRPRLDRFTPPEAVERESVSLNASPPATPTSTVAMSRLSFFGRRTPLKS